MISLPDKFLKQLSADLFFSNFIKDKREDRKDNSYKIIFSVGSVCNLSCSYCYEKDHQFSSISFDDYKEVLESFDSSKYEIIYVEFRGGEPLLHFSLIKKCIQYSETLSFHNKIIYYFITNGTLITQPVIDYLKSLGSKKVEIGVSLDGNIDLHNKNRCNSWGQIRFDLLKQLQCYIKICWTIGSDSLENIGVSLKTLISFGYPIRTNIDFYSKWSDEQTLQLLIDFSSLLADKEILLGLDHFLVFRKSQLLAYGQTAKTKFDNLCGSGLSRKFVLNKKTIVPCQLFMEEVDKNLVVENPSKCLTCKLFSICQKCYAFAYKKNKNFDISNGFCKLMSWKAIALAIYWKQRLLNTGFKNKSLIRNKISEILINETGAKIPIIRSIHGDQDFDNCLTYLCEQMNCRLETVASQLKNKKHTMLVMNYLGKDVGYLLLIENHIRLLFIEPDYQRGKKGTMLLSSCLDYVNENYKEYRKITAVSLEESLSFYVKNGFKIAKQNKNKYYLLEYDLSIK